VRVLTIDHYYENFLDALYRGVGRPRGNYAAQWRAVMDTCFGTADFYSKNLAALGHEGTEIVGNSLALQRQWAREHDSVPLPLRFLPERGAYPRGVRRWSDDIIIAQARAYRPDVVHVQHPLGISPRLFRELKASVPLVTAQIASYFQSIEPLKKFDLVLSSLPNYVERFRAHGIRSGWLGLGFEASLLDRVQRTDEHPVVFVGGVSVAHPIRNLLLERVAAEVPLEWWGYGARTLPPASPLRRRHRGEAWGLDAYRALAAGRICINRHEAIAGDYANNMRLFEATGVGTLLITDAKKNLPDLFEPGREVVVYRSDDELLELVRYYVEHAGEGRAIAAAGQRRTLAEHTYRHRLAKLVELLSALA
jgi:spore maturation protein CgeB